MILYTVQKEAVYKAAISSGIVYPNDSIMGEDYLYAYDWMAKKLEKAIGTNNRNSKYPFWAFTSIEGFYISKEELGHIFLKLEVPDSEVLTSDFVRWHTMLNESSYLYFKNGNTYDATKSIGKPSWWRIFKKYEEDGYEQACFWCIRKDMIIEAAPVHSVKGLTFVEDEG